MKVNLQYDTLSKWLSYLESKPCFFEDNTGPKRVKKVAKQLGCLDFDVPIITVAGTNGKGTTVSVLESLYTGQGYNTASFTSPHLFKFNERIKLNTKPVDDVLLCQALNTVWQLTVTLMYAILTLLFLYHICQPHFFY